MLKTSIRLNNDVAPGHFVRLATLAEELGFDQLWVSHDLFWRSAPVLLARAFQVTSRLRIGIGVLNPVSQHPAEIAMTAATLQEVSGGRFLLGIGAGADEFLGWARMPFDPPVPRTRRALLELRGLLSGQVPDGWAAQGHLRFSVPPPPVYVGAMGSRMLELAGELADGALPLLFPPDHFAVAAAQIARGARRASRDPTDLDVAACLWCSIASDPARGRRALAEKLAYYGASFSLDLLSRAGLGQADFAPIQDAMAAGDVEHAVTLVTPAMQSLGVAGGADDLADCCGRLLGAGARHLSFGPPLGPDLEAAIRIIGRDVVPGLRPGVA